MKIVREGFAAHLFRMLLLFGAMLLLATAQDTTLYAPTVRFQSNLLADCPEWTFGSDFPCEFTDPTPVPYREFVRYSVTIPANANFDLAITVASNRGDVDIQLLGPDGSVVSSSSERIGDDVVQVRRTALSKVPGNYTLSLQAVAEAMSEYTVRIQTTTTVVRLHPSELALIRSIAAQCCSPDDDQLPDSCTRLNAAISPNATDDDDLCLQPPNMCDSQGRLTKLVLSGGDKGNFVCPSFPKELGNFTQLTVLDWTSNSQVGTLASVAAVLAPLASTLRRLYLGRNAISGPLECSLVSQTALEILRLEFNLLSGTIPSCLFQSQSLKYLALSGNLLRGTIPQLPAMSGLNILDLSENGPPNGPSANNPGFSGSLPDLLNAVNLTSLDVSSNSLSGTIPPLPSGIQVLRAAYNQLSGPLPPSLDVARDLRVLDLSHNRLNGTLSGETTNNELLTVLRLAGNQLAGDLPFSSWGSFLVDVDLSENNFTAAFTPTLLYRPSVINLNLAFNKLSFNLTEVGRKFAANNSMLYFNISNNNVKGQLTVDLGKMLMFHQLLLQAVNDEALQGSMPPQPLFDVSSNDINSTFPIQLLPLLSQLYWSSPFEYLPLTLKLQPQRPTFGLNCPTVNVPLPDIDYLNELQALYNMTCMIPSGMVVNVTSYQAMQQQPARPPRPPKPPRPPSPPPLTPPRQPRRRPPPPPATPGESDTGGTVDNGNSLPSDKNGTGSSTPLPSDNKILLPPGQGAVQPTAVTSPPSPPPSLTPPAPDSGKNLDQAPQGSTKGAGIGGVVGGVVGAILGVTALAGLGWYLYRRRRNSDYHHRRMPLTHNATYEPAPSEGTASNYADMQMFELRVTDRPPRSRNRMA